LAYPLARHAADTSSGASPVAPEDAACTDAELRFIAEVVRAHSGIVIRENKSAMLRGRLLRRMAALGLATLRDYAALLKSPHMARELPALLNAVTTNHTAFFRERHHFDQLAEALPAMLAGPSRRLRLWSAACSSGEEAYSMAGVLVRAMGTQRSHDARILATDIDTDILRRAAAAEYTTDVLARAPADLRPLLQERPGSRAGHSLMGQALLERLRFEPLNLLEPWPFSGRFDVIFCRNVMIYFDQPTKHRLVTRFVEALQPGGLLFIGHSESLGSNYPELQLVGRTAYRRRLP
jgi:chemotaxis protein methyltransferase CheR